MKYLSLLLVIAIPAFASPTYLNCVVGEEPKTVSFSATINTETSTVSTLYSGDDGFTADAVLAPNTITWERKQQSVGIIILTSFELDRSTLNMRYTFMSYPANMSYEPTKSVKTGSCKVATVTKKAI